MAISVWPLLGDNGHGTAAFSVPCGGCRRLSSPDEGGGGGDLDRLGTHRTELFQPEIEKHHGRVFKLTGDGLFPAFGSVVDAVESAAPLQRGLAERNAELAEDKRIDVRIGINLGEVIVEGDDRFGEGVNVPQGLSSLPAKMLRANPTITRTLWRQG